MPTEKNETIEWIYAVLFLGFFAAIILLDSWFAQ